MKTMLATAKTSAISSHVWFYAGTVIVVGVAVMVILFCLKIAVEIYEEEERIRRQRREDKARTEKRNHRQ